MPFASSRLIASPPAVCSCVLRICRKRERESERAKARERESETERERERERETERVMVCEKATDRQTYKEQSVMLGLCTFAYTDINTHTHT
jgi:hypothetical protein